MRRPNLVEQLGPGGMLTPLGPVGPLGALGPLGPLGPTTPLVTFQGYQENLDGEFVPGLNGCYRPADAQEQGVHVCRTLLVPWTAQSTECTTETANCRRYELYESYAEAFAQRMTDNDTSFMVAGTTTEGTEDVYPFHSRDTQFVTVVLAPEEKPLWDLTALQGVLIAAGHIPGNPRFTRAMKYMPEAIIWARGRPSMITRPHSTTSISSCREHRSRWSSRALFLQYERPRRHGRVGAAEGARRRDAARTRNACTASHRDSR